MISQLITTPAVNGEIASYLIAKGSDQLLCLASFCNSNYHQDTCCYKQLRMRRYGSKNKIKFMKLYSTRAFVSAFEQSGFSLGTPITVLIDREILLNQTEIRLYLPCTYWFETKQTVSVWFQINRCMVNTISFRFDLTIFQKDFSVHRIQNIPHTEKPTFSASLNRRKEIWIKIKLQIKFALSKFRLVPNQSKNVITIQIRFNVSRKTKKRFPSVYAHLYKLESLAHPCMTTYTYILI